MLLILVGSMETVDSFAILLAGIFEDSDSVAGFSCQMFEEIGSLSIRPHAARRCMPRLVLEIECSRLIVLSTLTLGC